MFLRCDFGRDAVEPFFDYYRGSCEPCRVRVEHGPGACNGAVVVVVAEMDMIWLEAVVVWDRRGPVGV